MKKKKTFLYVKTRYKVTLCPSRIDSTYYISSHQFREFQLGLSTRAHLMRSKDVLDGGDRVTLDPTIDFVSFSDT